MTMIRIAEKKDKKDFYRLWKICFGDSDAFCDWFFENRFSPEHSVVLEEEGEIISCMQAFPYTIQIRGVSIPGTMLCGVSTHPDHRRKGLMGKIFSYEMNHLRKMGYHVAVHTPAVLPSYFSYGHFPVADAAYLKANVILSQNTHENCCIMNEKEWYRCYPLYESFAGKYSGIVKRTEEDFLRKAADYAADGGKMLAYIENNTVKGYTFYYQTDEEILCVETVAEDGYWGFLIEGLFARGAGLKFSAKLPPEVEIFYPFSVLEKLQKGVMGLCDAAGLLKVLNLQIPYSFRVKDSVVPENNGIFDFCGNSCQTEPVFEISAGHLLQVLVGYHSFNELKNEIEIYDAEKFEEIDLLLPKQSCYIIDEY